MMWNISGITCRHIYQSRPTKKFTFLSSLPLSTNLKTTSSDHIRAPAQQHNTVFFEVNSVWEVWSLLEIQFWWHNHFQRCGNETLRKQLHSYCVSLQERLQPGRFKHFRFLWDSFNFLDLLFWMILTPTKGRSFIKKKRLIYQGQIYQALKSLF